LSRKRLIQDWRFWVGIGVGLFLLWHPLSRRIIIFILPLGSGADDLLFIFALMAVAMWVGWEAVIMPTYELVMRRISKRRRVMLLRQRIAHLIQFAEEWTANLSDEASDSRMYEEDRTQETLQKVVRMRASLVQIKAMLTEARGAGHEQSLQMAYNALVGNAPVDLTWLALNNIRPRKGGTQDLRLEALVATRRQLQGDWPLVDRSLAPLAERSGVVTEIFAWIQHNERDDDNA
jgi:hypothetical protein